MSSAPKKPSFVERRSTWSFTVTAGKWVWSVIRPNKSQETSHAIFDSLTDCIEDATKHGYIPLKPAVDRRGREGE